MKNHREQRRHDIVLPIEVTVDGKLFQWETRNFSLGGVSIAAKLNLPYGTRVSLRFTIPTQPEPIEVGGSVRWAGEGGLGVQFDGLRAREVWALNKLFVRSAETP